MSRISDTFKQLKQDHRPGVIPFMTAGYPKLEATLDILNCLVDNGADVIELGMPFSDPMADGIDIQYASDVAIRQGCTLDWIFDVVTQFRQTNNTTPIVLMGYANPILSFGKQAFVDQAKQAGVDGLLVVDLPFDNQDDLGTLCAQADIDLINLIAPTTDPKRSQKIIDASSGFVYYVALKGITGSSHVDVSQIGQQLADLNIEKLPVAVGFGISNADIAKQVGQYADAVVIGSELIRQLRDAPNFTIGLNHVGQLINDIKQSTQQCYSLS